MKPSSPPLRYFALCGVHVASGGERLTVAGAALFPVGFDHADWHNGFEHDHEESVRVRVRLLQQAAASGEYLVATHLHFPSVGRVAADGDDFRWVAAFWDFRSEEHTTELQSIMRISYAVFCLKKKQDRHYIQLRGVTSTKKN